MDSKDQFENIRQILEFIATSTWSVLSYLRQRPLIIGLCYFPTYNNAIYYHETEKQECFLTIDDAPGNHEMMSTLLDELRELNVQLTFFIISSHVNDEREGIMERIADEGHHFGNHLCYDKSYFRATPEEFTKDLLTCEECLDKYSANWKEHGKWFRPPCGMLRNWMIPILEKYDYKIALGDVYAHDVAAQYFPDWVVDFTVRNTKPGSVIILHCPEKQKRECQVDIIIRTIKELHKNEYRIHSLRSFKFSELI